MAVPRILGKYGTRFFIHPSQTLQAYRVFVKPLVRCDEKANTCKVRMHTVPTLPYPSTNYATSHFIFRVYINFDENFRCGCLIRLDKLDGTAVSIQKRLNHAAIVDLQV